MAKEIKIKLRVGNSWARAKNNWNGYGAAPTTAKAIEAVSLITDAMLNGDFTIVPTTTGGAQIEGHSGDVDWELEIDPDGQCY